MPSVARLIEKHRDEIVRRWTEQAEQAASARGLTQPELLSIIPLYLMELTRLTSGEPKANGLRRRELVENHFGWRLRQGFDLVEIVEGFNLLGRCIAQTWASLPLVEQPEPSDVADLFAELHLAVMTVVELFQEHMQKDEQVEKRYLRMLRALADEALRTPALPLRERLQEVMELIMAAMGAQAAAILLYEPKVERLVTMAAAGAVSGELEQYIVSHSAPSFASRAATRDEPTSLLDVATTELQVSEQLRHSGIQGLLGIRLPPRFKLLGVLYVGISEPRPFSAREVRRLESLGEQLTLQLDNAQLYAELLSRAETLRRERDLHEQFVSVLAHDLRGPLSSVKAVAQLLLRYPERLDERRELASRMDRNITRLDHMIRDLLDTNRLQAGERLPLRLDTHDLGAIVREVSDELEVLHTARFLVDMEAGVRGVWSAEELRRAVWNLATNAVKYGAPDQPIILQVRRTPVGARVSVHNEGLAIAPEEQAHLFEPFSRLHKERTSGHEGWGLGLYLVRGCAEAHGGKVTVQSDAATGTTFTLELPLDARPYQTSSAGPPAEAGGPPPLL